MGKLLVVSTPIGNLKDITFRAKEVLGEVQIIACEDTRKTGLLLKKLNLTNQPKLLSYYEENETQRIPQIIKILQNNQDVALVSSAGTPTISDPGFKLVRACLEAKIRVESIPGPSAVLAALTASGLPTDKFIFWGFLPKKPGKRLKFIEKIKKTNEVTSLTNILFLSPHRIIKELEDLKEIFGDIEVVLAQELTKIHEQIKKEKISQMIENFKKRKPKGEFTLVFREPD